MILTEHNGIQNTYSFTIPLTYIGKGEDRRPKKKIKVDPAKLFSPAFIPYLTEKASIQIFFGGAGSGKSVFVARRTILDMLAGKRNFFVVRKVFGTLRDSFFTELEKAAYDLGVSKYFKFSVAPMEITCKTTGRKAIFRGLDKAEKIKSITVKRGILTDIIMEEATELTEPDFDLLDTRLRGECDVAKRITVLFNPIHDSHWLYERFFHGKFPDDAKLVRYDLKFHYTDYDGTTPKRVEGIRTIMIHKTNHWDNKFLAPEDRVRYESWKETNPYLYNVYALGNWGVLGDIIFPKFHIRDLKQEVKKFDKLYDGMDFGWFPDPFSYVVVGIKGRYIYVFLEEGGTKVVTKDIVGIVKPHLGKRYITCESAEPRTINELESLGLNVIPVVKWQDNNLNSIEFVNNYEIVVDYRCVNIIRELRSYAWDKDKNGKTISKPCDGNDHFIQAMYYALNDKIRGYLATRIGR